MIFGVLFAASPAFAGTEFYGAQMATEALTEGVWVYKADLFGSIPDRDGIEKRVTARARIAKKLGSFSRCLDLTIKNRSEQSISTWRDGLRFTVVTIHGKRYDLLLPTKTLYPSSDHIGPGETARFQPAFGKAKFRLKDIKMIVCSFELGRTKIILLPVHKTRRVDSNG